MMHPKMAALHLEVVVYLVQLGLRALVVHLQCMGEKKVLVVHCHREERALGVLGIPLLLEILGKGILQFGFTVVSGWIEVLKW